MIEAPIPKPTDAELAILRDLWRLGPCTVRDLADAQPPAHRRGYTTLLKLLQIMSEKGLVIRDESRRAHVYCARFDETTTQRLLLSDLKTKAFDGSIGKLVMRALSSGPASPDELAEIRRLLDQMEKGGAP